MRILLIAYACKPNSTSEPYVAWETLRGLSAIEGNEIHVLTRGKYVEGCIQGAMEEGIQARFYGIEAGRVWLWVKRRGKRVCPFDIYAKVWQFYAARSAKRLIALNGYDLVYQSTMMTIFSFAAPIASRISVVGPIGGAQLCPKSCWKYGGWIFQCVRSLGLKLFKYNMLWQLIMKRAGVVLLANNRNRWMFPRGARNIISLQIGNSRVSNGEYEVYREVSAENSGLGVIKLYWGGRLLKWKGLEILLRAVSKARLNGIQLTLSITGSGPNLGYFRDLCVKLSIEKDVHFLGKIPFEEMKSLRFTSDILWFTSLHETTGLALFEMMETGVPVAAVLCAATEEIAVNGTCLPIGVNQPINDAFKIIENYAISRSAGSGYVYEAIGQSARKRIQVVYDWKLYIENLQKILEFVACGNE